MNKLIYVFESRHGKIYVEAENDISMDGKIPASITQDADLLRVNTSFEGAMVNVENMYKSMLDVVKKLSPNEFNIEVGVKFNVKTGFFIVSAGSDIEFKVNLKWNVSNAKEDISAIKTD